MWMDQFRSSSSTNPALASSHEGSSPRRVPGCQIGFSGVPTLTLYGFRNAAVWDGNSATPSQKIFTVSTWISPGLFGLS